MENQSLSFILEQSDVDTLIITGWGWMDYACAAALALRHFERAEVVGMSTRRLPEFLSEVDGFKEILILGVGLVGNPKMLQNALERLAKKHVRVCWISAIDLPEDSFPDGCPELEVFVRDASLTECVGMYYGIPCDDLLPVLEEKTRDQTAQRYHLLLEAAMFSYRNYQDERSYGDAIRHLANRETNWTDSERKLVEHYKRYGNRELVGKSKPMSDLLDTINRAAPHVHARVLITGESGTGKETVALQIHNQSPLRDEPFIAFNCASVTPNLLESRFFGHERGAFTGANEMKTGLFEQANGGTLFLDEIGELPLEAQGILLRVLEGGRFTRLGGAKEIEVDVRLIAATNRDLAAMVRDGKFREDLFYRLNVVKIRVPSLREHKDDIGQIANSYWLKLHHHRLKEEQINALMTYDYPGNVRELYNLLECADVLEEQDFNKLITDQRATIGKLASTSDDDDTPDELEAVIRRHVRRVYEKYDHNITKTADALQIARNTVKKYLESRHNRQKNHATKSR